jgi:hypothetical protein
MNKKGFVFVETIIVITVLVTALITIYTAFLGVLSNEKRRLTFNDTSYLYETYYLEDYLTSLNLNNYLSNYFSGREIIEFSCDNYYLYNAISADATLDDKELAKEKFCENIINSKNIKLYITKYDVNTLKYCTTDAGKNSNECTAEIKETLSNVNNNFIYYLRTLSGKNEDNKYRLIAVYEEVSYDYDNTVKLDNNNKCPTGYENKSSGAKPCVKKNTANYYSNVAMTVKGDLVIPHVSYVYYENNVQLNIAPLKDTGDTYNRAECYLTKDNTTCAADNMADW